VICHIDLMEFVVHIDFEWCSFKVDYP
jgi:hypothetical protein